MKNKVGLYLGPGYIELNKVCSSRRGIKPIEPFFYPIVRKLIVMTLTLLPQNHYLWNLAHVFISDLGCSCRYFANIDSSSVGVNSSPSTKAFAPV